MTSENNTIRIGSSNIQTAAYVAGIWNSTITSAAVYVNAQGQLGIMTSSARFKQNIQSMGEASDALLSLRPVKFQYKKELDPKGSLQFGLVAEEVNEVDPDLVVHDGNNQVYSVRYEAVNAMLLNEFLKQHDAVEKRKAEIRDLRSELAALELKAAKADFVEQRLNELEQNVRAIAKGN